MGPQVSVQRSNKGVLNREVRRRIEEIAAVERQARVVAAETATRVTRESFEYKRKGTVERRPGRSSTGRKMRQKLRWVPVADGVAFDVNYADTAAEHWIIHELGTGQKGVLRRGGDANPEGRPALGNSYARTVKKQRGRAISSGLVFATNGVYKGTARRDQQLFLRSKVLGAPPRPGNRELYISREIEGQHMVQAGSRAGFQQYQTQVLLAARLAFADRRKP